MDKSNENFPKAPDQPHPNICTGARCAKKEVGKEDAADRRVHSSSIPPATSTPACPCDSVSTPVPPETQLPHLPKQRNPDPSSNGYANLYFSDFEDAPVFDEIVGDEVNKPIKPISTYNVYHLVVALKSKPYKVLKKHRKTIFQRELATIKREQSYPSASACFLSIAMHSVSQSIIHSHTDKIALYKKSDEACCADSGTSEYMFPDYSNFKTYLLLHNRCTAIGNTNKIPIEGIGTAIYTLLFSTKSKIAQSDQTSQSLTDQKQSNLF